MTKESIEKLSISLRKKWASGTRKPQPKESRQKASATLKKRYENGELTHKPLSDETKKRIGEINSQKLTGRVTRKTPLSDLEKEKIKQIGEEFRKTDPRAQKGPQNQCSKIWRIVSPSNKIYSFKNLMHFIRENKSLFNPNDVQWHQKGKKETTYTCKAHGGLSMLSPRRKKSHGVWKGWRWHSQTERLV
jgi:hypothetical protein